MLLSEAQVKEIETRLENNEGYHHTSTGTCDGLCESRGCCVKDRRVLLSDYLAMHRVVETTRNVKVLGCVGGGENIVLGWEEVDDALAALAQDANRTERINENTPTVPN